MLEDDNFVEASVYLTQPGDGLDTAVCCQQTVIHAAPTSCSQHYPMQT